MLRNYEIIQDQILSHLIKRKETAILSRKLGYKFNQVNRWINHSKKLKWDEFIELCKIVRFPIENKLEDTFGISIRNKSECKQAFVKILLSQSDQKQSIRQALHKSRPTLYRLQKSKTIPTFIDVLALIDTRDQRLVAFTNSFISENTNHIKRAPISIPWLSAVSSAMAQKDHLNLAEYSAEWVAKRVRLTVAEVELAVEVMLENELIEWNGTHFQPTRPRTLALNHQRSRTDFLRTLKFWIRKSFSAAEIHESMNTNSERFTGVFRIFMTSRETVNQINTLIAETEEKIHNLITSSEGEKTEIRSYVFTHFDVADTKVI